MVGRDVSLPAFSPLDNFKCYNIRNKRRRIEGVVFLIRLLPDIFVAIIGFHTFLQSTLCA